MVAVSEACGGADNLVLDNIVYYAEPAMRITMLSRLNLARTDYLRQAEELAHFAQYTEIKLTGKQFGKDLVSVVQHEKKNTRKCFKCGQMGHLKALCSEGRTFRSRVRTPDFALKVQEYTVEQGY